MKHFLKLSLAAAFSAGLSAQSFAAECIAPANPGGGWDFTCRTITKIMTDIDAYDGSIQVTNMAGGGGGLAYTHVVNERNSDDNLIVAASTATATRLAQNAYSGMTADQVRFLGAIGADPGVIVVAKDSPYQNLNDLLDAVIADPSKHAFAGGSAAGGFDHLKVLMALKRKMMKSATRLQRWWRWYIEVFRPVKRRVANRPRMNRAASLIGARMRGRMLRSKVQSMVLRQRVISQMTSLVESLRGAPAEHVRMAERIQALARGFLARLLKKRMLNAIRAPAQLHHGRLPLGPSCRLR